MTTFSHPNTHDSAESGVAKLAASDPQSFPEGTVSADTSTMKASALPRGSQPRLWNMVPRRREHGAPTETRDSQCPRCQGIFKRPVARLGGREVFQGAPVVCPSCSKDIEADLMRAQREEAAALERLAKARRERLPLEYQQAEAARVPSTLAPVLRWDPRSFRNGVGVVGPPNAGKSFAIACLLDRLQSPHFRWFNGSSIRNLAVRSATADGEERQRLAAEWDFLYRAGILVLDDVDKASFTAAWSDRLFDLLEQRRNRMLPTFWTANLPPAGIAAKIAQSTGDRGLGESIERRLCAGSLLVFANE